MSVRKSLWLSGLLLPLALFGCSDDSGNTNMGGSAVTGDGGGANGATNGATGDGGPGANGTGNGSYVDELEEKGLFRYLGQFTPGSENEMDGVTTYSYDVTPDGPQCIDGSSFKIGLRDQGSDSLLFYLQGGGACWTGFQTCTRTAIDGIPKSGGLDPSDPDNPMADWNHMHVSYCDGSLFVGDVVRDNGEAQHGLQNLSAAVDLAKEKFPDMTRIMLAGSSAGGFGTIWATGIIRKAYPDAELFVFNDSGIGIAKPDDPSFRKFLEDDWGATGLMPDSCADCQTSAHTTPLIEWGLERDENLEVAMFSSYGDDVIAGVFLMIPDDQFKTALLDETDKLHDANPDTLERFFIEGGQHTAFGTWAQTTKNGVSVRDWLTAMIDGDPAWTDMP